MGEYEMNWEALGAISELIGAVTVVVTLVYLAIQVRQHTSAIRSSSFQATTDALNHINMTIASDADLLRVISSKPDSLDELSPEDFYRYSYILLSLFRVRETAFYQQHQGTSAQQSWIREEVTLRKNLESAAAREWWKTIGYGFAPDFKQYVDNVIDEIERSNDT
jgi:hypothetical protein